jgi:CheY-like chemotaxis protein
MNTTSKRILVIEDEVPVQQLLNRILSRLGYEATITSDGAKALEILAAYPEEYALVITDLILPNFTGWDLLDYLKDQEPCAHIKTLVVSGLSASSEELDRLQSLCDCIMNKGEFSIASFETVLNKLLPSS